MTAIRYLFSRLVYGFLILGVMIRTLRQPKIDPFLQQGSLCPRCGSGSLKYEVNYPNPSDPTSPNYHLECPCCHSVF